MYECMYACACVAVSLSLLFPSHVWQDHRSQSLWHSNLAVHLRYLLSCTSYCELELSEDAMSSVQTCSMLHSGWVERESGEVECCTRRPKTTLGCLLLLLITISYLRQWLTWHLSTLRQNSWDPSQDGCVSDTHQPSIDCKAKNMMKTGSESYTLPSLAIAFQMTPAV